MSGVPSCLNRRYTALDNLIRELDNSSQNSIEPQGDSCNVGIRLMCDFWNILKDDPDCNLTQEVQQCMGVGSARTESIGNMFGLQRFITYRGCCNDTKVNDKKKSRKSEHLPKYTPPAPKPCSTKSEEMPLSKVLCNLQEAATYDQKCTTRVKELMKTQGELKKQIKVLEERERDGIGLLKQADNLWLCMEESYKNKVSESIDRQKELLAQLKEVEVSANKWRKNERDLEFQIKNMEKTKMNIVESINQKLIDVKIMDTEIANFEKRIQSNSKDLENTKNSLYSKRQASDARLSGIAAEIAKLQKRTQQEMDHKRSKEEEGAKYVKDARNDLQKICKVLLQKKIEHEDLRAERTAVLEELDLLNITADNCKEKCENKEKGIREEIQRLNNEIAVFKVKCIRCHVCTDTNDVRKLCTDCPKCSEERDCKYGDDTCAVDPTMDCVCMGVKQKLLDNIFDNMYTVLERKSKSAPGKAVAESVLHCLKRSINGKLNAETRKILQDFVLSTVKKNLNLTIVGGAVKTRCEMDPETYKQLMFCLNRVEVPKAIKFDKGTESKKDPCPRWSHSIECNCPKGPKDCACAKRAPPPPHDPTPCPQDPEDAGETVICPHRGGVCGTECGMQGIPALCNCADQSEIASWRPDPCSGPSCSYSQSMKETQYMHSSETHPSDPMPTPAPHVSDSPTMKSSPEPASVKSTPPSSPVLKLGKTSKNSTPTYIASKAPSKTGYMRSSDKLARDNMSTCTCCGVAKKPCPCQRDAKHLKANVGQCCGKRTATQRSATPVNDVVSKLPCVKKTSRGTKTIQSTVSSNSSKTQRSAPLVNDVDSKLPCVKKTSRGTKRIQSTASSNSSKTQRSATLVNDVVSKLPYVKKNSRGTKTIQSTVSSNSSKKTCDNKCDCYTIDASTIPSQEIISRHIIITFKNNRGLPDYQFTALAKSMSGKLFMELDEPIIDLMEKRTNDSSSLFVSLKKTNSGHLVVEFDSKDDVASNIQGVKVKKTLSGTHLLVMHKNLLSIIQDTEQKIPQINLKDIESTKVKKDKPCPHCAHVSSKKNCSLRQCDKIKQSKDNKNVVENTVSGSSPINIELRKAVRSKTASLGESSAEPLNNQESYESECKTAEFLKDLYNLSKTETNISDYSEISQTSMSLTSGTSKSNANENELHDYFVELEQMYDSGNAAITLLIKANNRFLNKAETLIFKSPSGTICANLNMPRSCLAHIPFDATYPVCLSKIASGSFLVNIDQSTQMYNAVLKKTQSGSIILVPISLEVQKDYESGSNTGSVSEKFFKIKVTGYKDYPVELPGVLKLTPSGNFKIILDKEFEKRYKIIVNDYVGEQRKCFVYLEKSHSGYTIDLNTNGAVAPEELNALLVKTRSGQIKVLVHGTVFECIDTMTPQRSSMSSAQLFGSLLSKLQPLSSREIHREYLRKSKFVHQKSSSDTQVYERMRVKLQVDKNLLADPSAILKQTESGQYAVILNKESKKNFINNLRSYLTCNPKGLVPIKRTDSGQILIVLNKDFIGKGHYGSLKITSSGNIYVIVNETALKRMTEKNKDNSKPSSAVIIKLSDFAKGIDKAVTTTCNARPEDCDCNSSKCVCAELQFETIDWLDHHNVINPDSTGRFREPMCWMKYDRDAGGKSSKGYCTTINRVETTQKSTSPYIVTKPEDYSKSIDKVTTTHEATSPYIVIKPGYEGRPPKKTSGSTEQCYYLFDTVCPYHIDRYNGVSNELLEISGLCNKPQKKFKNNVEFTSNNIKAGSSFKVPQVWDSLNYLPPQLPPFLSNINYR